MLYGSRAVYVEHVGWSDAEWLGGRGVSRWWGLGGVLRVEIREWCVVYLVAVVAAIVVGLFLVDCGGRSSIRL